MEKEVKRGYVKWTDEDGVFHKEPLADHPELLEDASPKEQLRAEEARRLNAAAEEAVAIDQEEADEAILDTLEALQDAPDNVLTAADLTVADDGEGHEEIVPVETHVSSSDLNNWSNESPAVVAEDEESWSADHAKALEQLRDETK